MTSAAQEKNKIRSLLERMPSKECHCNRCGARIAEGDARCAACGKRQQVRNTNLLDFLIAHTKDEITGKITDSIYEAVKNFLLSHLFGVVVSLSLVAAVGVTVYASEPYIDRVSEAQRPTLSAEQEMMLYELNLVAQELGYADAEEMLREQGDWETYEELFGKAGRKPNVQESAYTNEHDQVIAGQPNGSTYADGTTVPPADMLDVREAIEFYYFYAREDFLDDLTQMRLANYNGEHQMSKSLFRIQLNDGETYIPSDYLVQNLVFQPDQMSSEASKELASRGYTVAECNLVLLYDVPLSVLEQEKTDPEQCYTMTLVKTGGEPFKWSVAEDVLLYAMP